MKARELGPKKPSSSGNRLQAPKGGPQTCPKTLLSTQGPRVPESPPKAQQPLRPAAGQKGNIPGEWEGSDTLMPHPQGPQPRTKAEQTERQRPGCRRSTRTATQCRSGHRVGPGKPTPVPHAMENLAKNVAINGGRKEGEEPQGAQGSHCSNSLGRASLRRADKEGKERRQAVHMEKVEDSRQQEDETNKHPAPKVKAEPGMWMAGRLQEGLRQGPAAQRTR